MPGLIRSMRHEDGFPLENLLQELLMALMGYTGDVFIGTSTAGLHEEIVHPEHCTVQLAPDITWAGTEDRDQLNELVRLGFHYKQLQRFIQQEQLPSNQKSLYRQALCSGLTEVLAVYEDEVVRLEQLVQQLGAQRGVPGLIYELADLQMLLPQLHQLVFDIRRRAHPAMSSTVKQAPAAAADADSPPSSPDGNRAVNDTPDSPKVVSADTLVIPPEARGAKLLATLHAHRLNGQPLLQACLQRLLWHVNQVLFNQLTMWMVHGMLADEGGEFFIRPRAPPEATSSTQQQQQDQTGRPSDGGNTGPTAVAGSGRHMLQRTEDDTYKDWHEAFEVAMLELPPFITTHLATSVEFVGRAVRLLRSPPASAKLRQLQVSCSYNNQQQSWASAAGPQQQLLPHEDTLAFAAALRVLQQQPVVSQAALERTVEAIRADVASRLWELLVVQAGLMQHLSAIKDYLLLARGDFYQSFLADAARLLADVPREATANNDLAVPWLSAASKSSAQDDPHFKLFKLVLKPTAKHWPRTSDSAGLGGSGGGSGARALSVPSFDRKWDDLAIEAQLPWPLGVLLTPKHMEKYNKMFQLLLRLKRVQLALEQSWQELVRSCGRKGSTIQHDMVMPLLALRHHMGLLIGNLQVYLQVDVVESNFAQLQAKVAQAQDFSEAEYAHERFLHALVTQSFLGQHTLSSHLSEVFSQVTELSRLVKNSREQGIDWDAVKEINYAFHVTSSKLYVSLKSKTLQQFDKAPYLRQFYLRLDFNGWVDAHNFGHLRVMQADRVDKKQQQQEATQNP